MGRDHSKTGSAAPSAPRAPETKNTQAVSYLNQIFEELRPLEHERFWGDITIRFQNGTPVAIEKRQTKKLGNCDASRR